MSAEGGLDVMPERFRSRVRVNRAGCWVWTGTWSVASNGHYGYYRPEPGAKRVSAHRFAYQQLVGEIPAGLEIDHVCRNTLCCNPAHLEAVTHRENLLRGQTFNSRQTRQTHCKRGHPLTPENIYVRKRMRDCNQCREDRRERFYAKHGGRAAFARAYRARRKAEGRPVVRKRRAS